MSMSISPLFYEDALSDAIYSQRFANVKDRIQQNITKIEQKCDQPVPYRCKILAQECFEKAYLYVMPDDRKGHLADYVRDDYTKCALYNHYGMQPDWQPLPTQQNIIRKIENNIFRFIAE